MVALNLLSLIMSFLLPIEPWADSEYAECRYLCFSADYVFLFGASFFLQENPALSVAVKTCKNSTSDSVREKFLQEACRSLLWVLLTHYLTIATQYSLVYRRLASFVKGPFATYRPLLSLFFPCSDHASVWPSTHCETDGSYHRKSSLDHHGALHSWRGSRLMWIHKRLCSIWLFTWVYNNCIQYIEPRTNLY